MNEFMMQTHQEVVEVTFELDDPAFQTLIDLESEKESWRQQKLQDPFAEEEKASEERAAKEYEAEVQELFKITPFSYDEVRRQVDALNERYRAAAHLGAVDAFWVPRGLPSLLETHCQDLWKLYEECIVGEVSTTEEFEASVSSYVQRIGEARWTRRAEFRKRIHGYFKFPNIIPTVFFLGLAALTVFFTTIFAPLITDFNTLMSFGTPTVAVATLTVMVGRDLFKREPYLGY